MQIHRLPDVEPGLTSIVILAFNQWPTTKACLDSIFENTSRPFQLIVVDNASSDETPAELDRIAERDSRVTVIHNRSNLGFPGGNNQGMAVARGEYVLLLNNDTVVPAGWLERLLAPLEEDPTIGLVGPVTNYSSKWQMLENIASQYTMQTLDEWAARWADEHAGERQDAPSLVGFALLMRREVVERTGGLDERFGVGNFEDDDICERGKLLGFRCVIAVDCFIHHEGSKSFTAEGLERFSRTLKRNWEIYRQKWRLAAAEYASPQMRTFADLGRFDQSYGAQPLPELGLDHIATVYADGGVIWNPDEDEKIVVARADWWLGGPDDQAVAGVCDVLERNGQHVVRLPFTATTLASSTLIVPASQLDAPGAGCLVAVCDDPARLKPTGPAELNRRADMILVADDADRQELVAHGVAPGIIEIVEPELAGMFRRWTAEQRIPVRELEPVAIEGRSTIVVVGDNVGTPEWAESIRLYLQHVPAVADATLVVVAPAGSAAETADTLTELLAQWRVEEPFADVCLHEHDGSVDSVQLTADFVLSSSPSRVRRAPQLQPDEHALARFAATLSVV